MTGDESPFRDVNENHSVGSYLSSHTSTEGRGSATSATAADDDVIDDVSDGGGGAMT